MRRAQRGLSLVELMVGVLIGMLTVVAISHVLMTAESQKRTATSGGDAQVNGTLALYALQRDVEMAGYGLTGQPAALGCDVKGQYGSGTSAKVLPALSLVPARITPGSGATPDQITVWQSNKPSYAVPLRVAESHTQTSTRFIVPSTFGVAAGDLLVAVPPTPSATAWCSVLAVAADSSTALTSTQIPHLADLGGWNAVGSDLLPTAGYPAGSHLINLGTGLPRTYSISAGKSLVATDVLATSGGTSVQTIAPQIVQLKALYGKDTDGNGTIDAFNTTAPATNAAWLQVMALRVAVVAQSAQLEPVRDGGSPVTPAIGVEWVVDARTDGAVACSTDSSQKCVRIDVSGVGSDWRNYRYKVFDTVVPLRNMLWTRG
jgi:type IV pilus assembly protein PilW